MHESEWSIAVSRSGRITLENVESPDEICHMDSVSITRAVEFIALAGARLADDDAATALLAVDAQGIEHFPLVRQERHVFRGKRLFRQAEVGADHDGTFLLGRHRIVTSRPLVRGAQPLRRAPGSWGLPALGFVSTRPHARRRFSRSRC